MYLQVIVKIYEKLTKNNELLNTFVQTQHYLLMFCAANIIFLCNLMNT